MIRRYFRHVISVDEALKRGWLPSQPGSTWRSSARMTPIRANIFGPRGIMLKRHEAGKVTARAAWAALAPISAVVFAPLGELRAYPFRADGAAQSELVAPFGEMGLAEKTSR